MKDRNVEFPHRFRLTPVEGTDNIVDITPVPGDVIEEGSLWSKANVLPDYIPNLLGLKMADPQVKDALDVLANVGSIHVWKRDTTATGVTDYPTSTDRNAYGEGLQDTVPAGYTLGNAQRMVIHGIASAVGNLNGTGTISYSDTISVASDGAVSLVDPQTVEVGYHETENESILLGKFVESAFTEDGQQGDIFFIPTDGARETTMQHFNSTLYNISYFSNAQPVLGYPETGSAYLTYLGALGDKARIEVGSYVGTGTYGGGNPNRLTFQDVPKLVFVFGGTGNGTYNAIFHHGSDIPMYATLYSSTVMNTTFVDFQGADLIWHQTGNANTQGNTSGVTYTVYSVY